MGNAEKKIIGRREVVDFPDLQLHEVEAKIDTGAYTSAIHCHNIREETRADGLRVIRFQVLDPSHPQYEDRTFEFRNFVQKGIRNSFGDVQERYVIRTRIKLFDEILEADFSLSDRSDLKYPVLIGRTLLQRNFIVDVSRKNVAQKQMKRAEKRRKKS